MSANLEHRKKCQDAKERKLKKEQNQIPCVSCEQGKPIFAFGKCYNCYHNEWSEKNRDKINAAAQRWRARHPDKVRASRQRDLEKHPERNLKNNPDLREKCARQRIEVIYRKHDEGLKDDPERLDIREHVKAIVEGETDDWQFRAV